MDLGDLTSRLDGFFDIASLQPDMPFSALVPSAYAQAGIDPRAHFQGAFLELYHGLMLRNSDAVQASYTSVFLSDEIVRKVVACAPPDSLLICHHPLVMETSDRGFLPLSIDSLYALRDAKVSVYVLHTPLDVHEDLSPSSALARGLELSHEGRFHQVDKGYAGVYGTLPRAVGFEDLLDRVRQVTGVADVHAICNRSQVRRLAVLGGGIDADGILKVEALNCDALVTGTYWNAVQNEIGRRYREAFERVRGRLTINLVECSHYASEAVVIKTDMVDLMATQWGLPCEYVPQDDPWY